MNKTCWGLSRVLLDVESCSLFCDSCWVVEGFSLNDFQAVILMQMQYEGSWHSCRCRTTTCVLLIMEILPAVPGLTFSGIPVILLSCRLEQPHRSLHFWVEMSYLTSQCANTVWVNSGWLFFDGVGMRGSGLQFWDVFSGRGSFLFSGASGGFQTLTRTSVMHAERMASCRVDLYSVLMFSLLRRDLNLSLCLRLSFSCRSNSAHTEKRRSDCCWVTDKDMKLSTLWIINSVLIELRGAFYGVDRHNIWWLQLGWAWRSCKITAVEKSDVVQ